MKTKNRKTLPLYSSEILNGGLYQQKKTCRTPNCKCTRGEKHIAYYFFTRINGKLTKTYIRKSEIKNFSEMVNQAKAERMDRRQAVKKSYELLRQLRNSLRERVSLINLLRG